MQLTADGSAAAADVLGRIATALDDLPAQRPVAARVIGAADDLRSSAKTLGEVVSYDPALTAKLMRLANSAYFGLRGRVSSPSFAVTVVGFSTVRSLAVAAMAGLDDESALPERFWERSLLCAVASGELAPRLGVRAPDAFGLGLLARLGQALLHRCDDGYRELVASSPDRADLLVAESRAYGVTHVRLSAEALASWGFPADMPEGLLQVARGGVSVPLAAAVSAGIEISERIVNPEHRRAAVERLTAGRWREAEIEHLCSVVTAQSEELSRLLA
ncbi:HD-like signal output (HDOD) protein [Kineococcus xinjiangensis]|uniref:HD-like signal output (HDOD) protein n=1 Tax=Kineococcus xinjiangensis TaxID=512762 RepID=A0A2S6IVR0_9ACTN|nr:HDOD domain-containing protein [Kineococcus xinjiangensis]PPK98366.1 HD-like signal output (HDOD) protein [Kineococcus xinjiangensis]